jgi:hypothetical protein
MTLFPQQLSPKGIQLDVLMCGMNTFQSRLNNVNNNSMNSSPKIDKQMLLNFVLLCNVLAREPQ